MRFVKRLVTVLTATMIAGLLVIITLFVIRFREPAPLALPENLALPAGATATAITTTRDRVIVLTEEGEVFVFAPTGELRQRVRLSSD